MRAVFNSTISFLVWYALNVILNIVSYTASYDESYTSGTVVFCIGFCLILGLNVLLGYFLMLKTKNNLTDYFSVSVLHIIIMAVCLILLYKGTCEENYVKWLVITLVFPSEFFNSTQMNEILDYLISFIYSLIPYLFIWLGMVLKRKKQEKKLLLERNI